MRGDHRDRGHGRAGLGQLRSRRTFVRKVLEQSREQKQVLLHRAQQRGQRRRPDHQGAWKRLYVGGMIDSKIILVGYSRGAAYCMKLAETWQRAWGGAKQIEVLVMFDAVARNKYSDSMSPVREAWKHGWTEIDIPAGCRAVSRPACMPPATRWHARALASAMSASRFRVGARPMKIRRLWARTVRWAAPLSMPFPGRCGLSGQEGTVAGCLRLAPQQGDAGGSPVRRRAGSCRHRSSSGRRCSR